MTNTIILSFISVFILFVGCATPVDNNEFINDSPFSVITFGTDSTFEIGTWNLENYPKATDTNNYLRDLILAMDIIKEKIEKIGLLTNKS